MKGMHFGGSRSGSGRRKAKAGKDPLAVLELMEPLEQRLLLAAWYVDASAVGPGDGSVGSPFPTIQAGIDAAGANDTVNVANGTYDENLTVDKTGLELLSANGAGLTTITLGGGVGISIDADSVSLGSPGHGFTIVADATTTYDVALTGTRSDVTIAGNDITTVGDATRGISVAHSIGLTLTGNTLLGDEGDTLLMWDPATASLAEGTVINDNSFLVDSGNFTDAIVLTNLAGGMAITENDFGAPIIVYVGTGGVNSSGLTIRGNIPNEQGQSHNGLGIVFQRLDAGSTGTLSNVDISQNLFNESFGGVVFDGSAAVTGLQAGNIAWGTLGIHQNNFANSPQALWLFGAKMNQSVTIDATNNFWGSDGGPVTPDNTYLAAGGNDGSSTIVWDGADANDIATAIVDYLPWWTDLGGTVGSYTGTEFIPVTNLTQETDFASLQAAVDAADNGDTIQANDGTFVEDLAIANVTGLTLQSANGSTAGTTIRLVDGVGIEVQGTASGFALGSAQRGFEILSGAGTTYLAQVTDSPTGVSFIGNDFDLTGNATRGISVDNNGTTGLAIDDNIFANAESNEIGIYAPFSVNLTIANNDFTAASLTGTTAIQLAGATATAGNSSSVTGSSITGFAKGILIQNGHGVSNLLVEDNLVTQGGTGIEVSEFNPDGTAGNATTLVIAENELTGNVTGVLIGNGPHVLAGNFGVIQNTIAGNDTGLENQNLSQPVDATANWWGSAGGPDIASNSTFNLAAGRGDSIVETIPGSVSYVPWLGSAEGGMVTPVTNTTKGTFYATIGGAIGDADPGNTITAAAGIFTEELVFADITGLTLLGAAPAAGGTTIQFTDGVGIAIDSTADDTTIGDATHGLTLLGGAGTTDMIQLVGGPSGVEIAGNTIDLAGSATRGIAVDEAGSTGLVIDSNDFLSDEDTETGVYAPFSVDLSIVDNAFLGDGSDDSVAIRLAGATATPAAPSTVSGNQIVSFSRGILIQNGQGVSDLLVDGNTITNGGTGIEVAQFDPLGAGDTTTLTITDNTIQGNETGLLIGDGAHVLAGQFLVSGNSLTGNGVGLDHQHLSQTLDAAGNWWGSAAGPTIATNVAYQPGVARGDSIIQGVPGSVSYVPWLNAADGNLLAPVTNLTQGLDYASIQAAIDAAAPGDVLHAAAGTFRENITVDEAVQLTGAGRASTTLEGAAHGPTVTIDHVGTSAAGDNILLGGLTIRPLQTATAADDYPVLIADDSAYVTVRDNLIDATTVVSASIFVGTNTDHLTIEDNAIPYNLLGIDFDVSNTAPDEGPTNLTIHGNTMTAEADDSTAVEVGKGSTVVIDGNTFDVSIDDGNALTTTVAVFADDIGLTISRNTVTGSELAGAANASTGFILEDINGVSTVWGNTLDGLADGIVVTQGSGDLGSDGLLIGGPGGAAENFIRASAHAGIFIYSSDQAVGVIGHVTVQGNRFFSNFVGLQVGEPGFTSDQIVASRFTVKENNFGLDNATAMANYETTTAPAASSDVITPSGDWWGTSKGPRHATNPTGTGALVTGLANFALKNFRTTVTLPRPDLTAAITNAKITLPALVVPGDKGTVPVVVTNLGDGPAKGKVVVKVYMSTDEIYDAGDTLMGTLTPTMNILAGKSMSYSVPVVVPQVGVGNGYHVVVVVDQTDVLNNELREDNNTAGSTATYNVTYQFGQIAGRKGNIAMTLADPVTGDPVVFSSTGAGNGVVVVGAGEGFDINLTGLVKTSAVTVKTPVKGDKATLRDVTSGTGFATFNAATADLVGLLSITGSITTLTMGAVTSGDVAISGAVGTLACLGWTGNINADTLGTLKVTGNFNTDLVLANAAAAAVALKTVTITGGVTGATWILNSGGMGTAKITGAVNTLALTVPGALTSLTTGNMTGSTIGVGGAASLTMANVADTDVTVGGALKLASAQQWVGGAIAADTLGTLKVTGDFSADLALANAAAVAVALKTATITGSVTNATWVLNSGGMGTSKITGTVNTLALTVPGALTGLTTGNMTDSTIGVGGAASLTMANVADTDVTVGGALKLASAQQWIGGSITANTITTLNITGKLGGTGNLDGVAVVANNPAHVKTGIGTVNVAGNMQNGSSIASTGDLGTVSVLKDMVGSTISAASKITSVKAGKMLNSTVFAGVADPVDDDEDGVFDLPTALGDGAGQIASGHTIAKVDILGYKGAVGSLFVNSNIAAQTVSLVNLKDVTLDNGGVTFGIAGQTITKVTCKQGTVLYTWAAGQWKPNLVPDDLTIRVIPV